MDACRSFRTETERRSFSIFATWTVTLIGIREFLLSEVFPLDKLSGLVNNNTKPLSYFVSQRKLMGKEEIRRYLASIGSKGGKAASARMTKQQRIERARKAGQANKGKSKKGEQK